MTREKLHKEFKLLREQATFLLQTCHFFKDLFESDDPKVLTLLHESAGSFFINLHQMMSEYIPLLVCRLTDLPKTSGKTNLTIQHMNKLLSENNCFSPEIATLTDGIIAYRKLLEPVRNKIGAHNDHDTFIFSRTLGKHKEEEMNKFFEDDLPKYFDAVGNAIGVADRHIDNIYYLGDANELIDVLRCGLDAIMPSPRPSPSDPST